MAPSVAASAPQYYVGQAEQGVRGRSASGTVCALVLVAYVVSVYVVCMVRAQ